jgi:hypothetical protein
MPRRLPALAALLVVLAAAGCAILAKRTPTPANDIDREELARRPVPPGVRYYVVLFGSETKPILRPKYTHTWAAAVRAVDQPGGSPALEVNTISWMPATLEIRPLSREVEPGRNLSLEESIENATRTGQEIAMWGPYEVWHGAYYRFMVQKAFLESGRVGYQCIDSWGEAGRTGDGCDCIHAITDLDPEFGRARYPLSFFGQPATANLTRRLMTAGSIINPPCTHDWLIPALGLDRCDIERRQYKGRVKPYLPTAGGPCGPTFAPSEPTPPAAPAPKADVKGPGI